MEEKKIVPAPISSRFFAFLIDIFFVYLLRFLYVNISVRFWLREPVQSFMSKYKMLYGDFDMRRITSIEVYYFLNSTLFKQLMLFVVGTFLVSVAYNIFFLMTKWSATIGQRILGIYAVSKNGERMKFYQIILRSFAVVLPWFFIFVVLFYKSLSDISATEIISRTTFVVSILIFLSWYDLIVLTKDKLIFHDIISGTRMTVNDPKKYETESHGVWSSLFPNFKDMYNNLKGLVDAQVAKANDIKEQYNKEKSKSKKTKK